MPFEYRRKNTNDKWIPYRKTAHSFANENKECHNSNITRCLRGRQKNCGPYEFRKMTEEKLKEVAEEEAKEKAEQESFKQALALLPPHEAEMRRIEALIKDELILACVIDHIEGGTDYSDPTKLRCIMQSENSKWENRHNHHTILHQHVVHGTQWFVNKDLAQMVLGDSYKEDDLQDVYWEPDEAAEGEEFRKFEGDLVSNFGRVWRSGASKPYTPAAQNTPQGYEQVSFNSQQRRFHRVVACAFGLLDDINFTTDEVVNHIDLKKCNNFLLNLEKMTTAENTQAPVTLTTPMVLYIFLSTG